MSTLADYGSGREQGPGLGLALGHASPCGWVAGKHSHTWSQPGGPPLLLCGTRTAQEALQESALKELGRLQGQLGSLRHELEALALKQSSVADEVGLLPQRIQAVRDDVSSHQPETTSPGPWASLVNWARPRQCLLSRSASHPCPRRAWAPAVPPQLCSARRWSLSSLPGLLSSFAAAGEPAPGCCRGRSSRLSCESWRARSWPRWPRRRAPRPGRPQPPSV